MSSVIGNVPADFPLDTIGRLVDRIALPEEAFDASGSWQSRFGVYSTVGNGSRVGQLSLQRVVKPGGRVLLDMKYEKTHLGGRQQITAKIHLPAHSRLSTPSDWSFRAHVLDASGRVFENTRIKKSVVVNSGTMTVHDASGSTEIPLQGEYALNWALFDAVGRLPAERMTRARFTLIDHFDQVKPDHVLSFRTTTDVTIGGRARRLHAYDQLGRGIVPWVWWVDEDGRLLAAVSGLETYLRESPQ